MAPPFSLHAALGCRLHVRCAVDLDTTGRPTQVRVAGQVWPVEGASLLPVRRFWLARRPARWRVSYGSVTLELYAREYVPGAAGLTWWWLVLPERALASLHLQRSPGGRGVMPLESRLGG